MLGRVVACTSESRVEGRRGDVWPGHTRLPSPRIRVCGGNVKTRKRGYKFSTEGVLREDLTDWVSVEMSYLPFRYRICPVTRTKQRARGRSERPEHYSLPVAPKKTGRTGQEDPSRGVMWGSDVERPLTPTIG